MRVSPQLVAAARSNTEEGLKARRTLFAYCKDKFFSVATDCKLFDYIDEVKTELVFENSYYRLMRELHQIKTIAIPFFPVFNTNHIPLDALLHLIAQITYKDEPCIMSQAVVDSLKKNLYKGAYTSWHVAKKNEPLHFLIEANPHASKYASIAKYIENTGYMAGYVNMSISEIISMLIFFPWYIQHASFVSALTSRRDEQSNYHHVGIFSWDAHRDSYCECKEQSQYDGSNDDVSICAATKRLYV